MTSSDPDGAGETIIRASSVPDFLRCQRRWAAKHCATLIRDKTGVALASVPTSIAAPIGTAVHRAAERFAMGDTERQSIDAAVTRLQEAMAEAGAVEMDVTATTRDEAQKQVIRLSARLLLDRGPVVRSAQVEQRLTARLSPGILVSGQTDQLALDEASTHVLRDVKTGARLPDGAQAQVGTYRVIRAAHGLETPRLVIDHVRRVPLRREQPPVASVEVDAQAAGRAALATLRAMARTVETFRETGDPDAFLPNPAGWHCSRRWCPAYRTELCRLAWTDEMKATEGDKS